MKAVLTITSTVAVLFTLVWYLLFDHSLEALGALYLLGAFGIVLIGSQSVGSRSITAADLLEQYQIENIEDANLLFPAETTMKPLLRVSCSAALLGVIGSGLLFIGLL